MAANTPTIITASGQTVRLNEILQIIASAYAGAGTLRGRRWQVSATNSFPASDANRKWDTRHRASDSRSQGAQWVEIPLESLELAANTTYYLSCADLNTSAETSSWATAISIVTEANLYTSTKWTQGQ
mgnify:CR=1 FL=1